MIYKGIFTEKGNNIREEDSYEYALERVKNNKDDKKEFTEWFYSGNWIKKGDDELWKMNT